jgi:hypothetical protein
MAAPKPKSAMAKANRALAMAGQLSAARERKFVVTSIVQSADSTGHLIALNNPVQGVGDQQRVGDRIRCVRLIFDAWRVIPGSATGRFSLRFLIVLDKQNTLTDVDQIFLGMGTNICPFNQFVKDYKRQFSVLYDSGPNHMDQYNKGDTRRHNSRMNLITQFIAGTTTIATGMLKLVVLTNQAANSNNKPILLGTFRVNYTDS